MDIWRIEKFHNGHRTKVHFYQSEKAYKRGWKHHQEYAEWYNVKIDGKWNNPPSHGLVGYDDKDNILESYNHKPEGKKKK